MKRIIKLICCVVAVSILCSENVFSAPDEDTVTSKKAKKAVASTAKIEDRDNDKVPDNEDECPNIPGPMATKGCPDTDGDGIPDHQDDCPTVFGLVQYRGCPDSDLDGIPDNKDVCPYEAGPASNNGCPLPTSKENSHPSKRTKVIDTISLDDKRNNLELMYYDQYLAEQELSQQDYLNRHENSYQFDSANTRLRDKNSLENIRNANNNVGNDKEKKVVGTSLSTVKIDNAIFQSYKPKLEALLVDMKFQEGRVLFADDNKFFNALSELASYHKSYPEWIMTFHCYSNESDNVYGNKQLFSNRVHRLKQILVDDLHIPVQKLHFINHISNTSEIFNYISLEITVK